MVKNGAEAANESDAVEAASRLERMFDEPRCVDLGQLSILRPATLEKCFVVRDQIAVTERACAALIVSICPTGRLKVARAARDLSRNAISADVST